MWRSAVAWIGSTISEKDIAASNSSSLRTEAEYFLETLTQFFQPTMCRIPKERNHNIHRHERLKTN
jgi:hypothetical protein